MEITRNMDEIDSLKNPDLVPVILKKAGELGLLGIAVCEEYGGLGMSFNRSMLIAYIIGAAGSFSTTYGAHSGIGTLPVLYYWMDGAKGKIHFPSLPMRNGRPVIASRNQMQDLMQTVAKPKLH